MRKKKTAEVEKVVTEKSKVKDVLAVEKMEILLPLFGDGDKVRYMSTYGTLTGTWEMEPYRILSRSLQYRWNNDMKFAYLYRLRRWHSVVEYEGWAAWQTVTAWEDQLEFWHCSDQPNYQYSVSWRKGVEPSPQCAEEMEPLD